MSDTPALDPEALAEHIGRIVAYKQGELVSFMIHLGDHLGLYRAMAGAGAVSAAELADRTGLHERWLLEWLRSQAAAGIAERSTAHADHVERFELPLASVVALAHEDTPGFVGGFFGPPMRPEEVGRTYDAFRTGIGQPWDAHGAEGAHWVERMTRPSHRMLADAVLPLLDGVVERLETGARVLDVGCGSGVAVCQLARRFPASVFTGIDPSGEALARARTNADGLDNVEWREIPAEFLADDDEFDLVLTLDCMHDMTRPADAVAAVRRALHDDGTWLVKDLKCGPTYEDNAENPIAALLYSMSVSYCLSSSMSEPGGAGLGTVGFHPGVAREMATAAGFTRFTVHETPADRGNFYYEIRP